MRELCAQRHITIHTKKKEELIAALMEVEPIIKQKEDAAPTGPSTGELTPSRATSDRAIDGIVGLYHL